MSTMWDLGKETSQALGPADLWDNKLVVFVAAQFYGNLLQQQGET